MKMVLYVTFNCLWVCISYAVPTGLTVINESYKEAQLFLPAVRRAAIKVDPARGENCHAYRRIEHDKLQGCMVSNGVKLPAIQTHSKLYVILKQCSSVHDNRFRILFYDYPRAKTQERLNLSDLVKVCSLESTEKLTVIIAQDGILYTDV